HHAAVVWPNRSAYYQKIERNIAADILRYEYNPTTQTLTVGDWVTKESKYYYLLRTSDVMPDVFDDLYEISPWNMARKLKIMENGWSSGHG
uniref:hypothetical protein n=1 Tax=Duncaniella muris TaxID=2094150 RepID=UPI0025A66C24